MAEGSRPGSGQGSQPGPDGVALTRSPGFWRLMGYAAFFGVVLAFASLAFLGLVQGGTDLWFTLPKNPGWFDGSLWWVAVTGAAGVLVGVLRRLFRLPAKLPGTRRGAEGRACRALHGPEGGCRSRCRSPAERASDRRGGWACWGAGWEPGSRAQETQPKTCGRRTRSPVDGGRSYGASWRLGLADDSGVEIARPKASAHPNIATVGSPNSGTLGMRSARTFRAR